MPVHLKENPYHGINAHFNSLLQNMSGGWPTFHSPHITHLAEELNRILPEQYYAVSEQSLQIELLGVESAKVRPDITVLQRRQPATRRSSASIATPTLELAAAALAVDEDDLTAIMIYRAPDEPITRIELLSPANKTNHQRHYLSARQKSLQLGLKLVELDYLHQSPSLFSPVIPDYASHAADAYPYNIIVTDPTPIPESESGLSRVYCFHVDEPILAIPIPLAGSEQIAIDLSMVYHTTFMKDRRPYLMLDYEQLPAAFETYNPLDQACIHAIMERIVSASPL